LVAACLLVSAAAFADTVSVNGTAVIYAAGNQSSAAAIAGGTVPGYISVSQGNYLTFTVGGTVSLNIGTGSNYNNPDGVGAAVSSSYETGYGNISGITAPNAGFLVGVFLAPGGPSTPATPLSYSSTSATTYSPTLDQVFFIGDGLTGNGTGTVQDFYVPTGATSLYLGISDAPGYFGGLGGYGDNAGAFTVTSNSFPTSSSPTPEPSSFALLLTGSFAFIAAIGRRVRLV
jgi:hypothetical protein